MSYNGAVGIRPFFALRVFLSNQKLEDSLL